MSIERDNQFLSDKPIEDRLEVSDQDDPRIIATKNARTRGTRPSGGPVVFGEMGKIPFVDRESIAVDSEQIPFDEPSEMTSGDWLEVPGAGVAIIPTIKQSPNPDRLI